MIIKSKKTTVDKINIYRNLFLSRLDVYGTYNVVSKKSYQIKKPVDDNVLMKHLTGKQPYGMYLLNQKITKAIVVDFDDQNKSNPSNFVFQAKHYGIPSYIEVSKSKGFHVWMFCFGDGISAVKARTVAIEILKDIDCAHTEVFPKQNSTGNVTKYGNFINTPLFGSLVFNNKTVFIDPVNFEPYQDQWTFLENVKLVKEEDLTNLIEMNEWQLIDSNSNKKISKYSNSFKKSSTLLPCAKQMLSGVLTNQRVICFRLAIHFKSIGVSKKETIKTLTQWAQKNTPISSKRIITEEEIISQTQYAYEKGYSSYGCGTTEVKQYCDPLCKLHGKKI